MEEPASSIAAASSLWGSLNSWFTSTVFFILLNLMIATILFTSNLPQQNNNNNQTQQQQNHQEQEDQNQKQNHPQIATSPSILHRLKSFNFLPQKPLTQLHHDDDDDVSRHEHEPLHVAATQYVFNQPLHYQHFDFDSDPTHQVERLGNEFEFDPTRLETSKVEDAGFDFDPAQKENEYPSFDFDPTQKENEYPGFDFDPTRKENEYPGVDFEPTREEGNGDDDGFGLDPTREDEQTDQFQSLDEVYSKLKGGGGGHHDRTKSESEIRPKPTTKFKKSASLKVGFSHLDKKKAVEARRPATVRERKAAAEDDDVEVDSKADDFINKFKNDLKLQRIESIMKSKSGKK